MISAKWKQIVKADLYAVMREPFFWLILLSPMLLGVGLRYFLPYLTGQFQNFDLRDYYPVIIALSILTPPLYYGIVLALQVLEEKDENVLIAIAVTPIKLRTYLAARIAVYTIISLPQIVIVHQLIGVIEIQLVKLIWVAIAASLNTSLIVMLLAALAKNQLEGMVMGKGLGFIILLPLAMYFVPDYWHLVCGVLPTYWPIIAYYTAVSDTGSDVFFALAIVMAVLSQLFAIRMLYSRFERSLL